MYNDNSAPMSENGLVTASARGEAFVMARFETKTVGSQVLVLPKDSANEVEFDVGDHVDDISVQAHRVSLLQVMGNIILNAYESIQRSETPNGRIGVTVSEETIDDQPMVRLPAMNLTHGGPI